MSQEGQKGPNDWSWCPLSLGGEGTGENDESKQERRACILCAGWSKCLQPSAFLSKASDVHGVTASELRKAGQSLCQAGRGQAVT